MIMLMKMLKNKNENVAIIKKKFPRFFYKWMHRLKTKTAFINKFQLTLKLIIGHRYMSGLSL